MTTLMQPPSTDPHTDPHTGGHRRVLAVGGGLVAVAAAAAVTAAVVAGTGGAPAHAETPPAAPAAAAAPAQATAAQATAAQATEAFAAATADTRSDVVAVPGGFEGADLTGGTTIRFWTSPDGTTWTAAGASTYPALAAVGAPPATIEEAGVPAGAPHAVFVVADRGATGDGSGVDVAYSDGSAGFGAVKGAADGDLHPSGEGVDELGEVGTSYDEFLRDGLLVTADCSDSVALAECGLPANQIEKSWRWSGDAFVLDHRSGPAS